MLIDWKVDTYCITETQNLIEALEKLSRVKGQILFVVDHLGRLTGTFTDGDFRRWIVAQKEISLRVPVKDASNAVPIYSFDYESPANLAEKLSLRIRHLPIVDANQRLVGIASLQSNYELTIGHYNINEESPVFTIAEIGNNHNGSIERARLLVEKAKESGADCVKFQMRDLDTLYGSSLVQTDKEDLGSQYVLDLLTRFQLKREEFQEIFDYSKSLGLAVLCTPFDEVSADWLNDYGLDGFKIASADLTNHGLLQHISTFGKPMVVSTGMSTEQEIFEAVKVLRQNAAQFMLLHCNSTYPAPFKDVHLNYMDRLAEIGDCLVGYSGHERGFYVAVAAVAKGAKIVEKHFTLDREMEGNDHKVSLLPSEFKEMQFAIKQVQESLGNNKPRNLSQGELMNRETLGKSIFAKQKISKGTRLTAQMLSVRSPGSGLSPARLKDLIGRPTVRNLNSGDFFYETDIHDNAARPRPFNFDLKYGIPVRYHDYPSLAHLSKLDFVEFHLSYKDLELDFENYIDGEQPIEFIVHAPELFAGDHTLDLCSTDPVYRTRSIKELQRVIHVTRRLNPFFPQTSLPQIVVNVGGFSENDFISEREKIERYELLADSLSRLDLIGVSILAQTMPPFPWHFGGQRFHNLFVTPDEIIKFSKQLGLGVCFDVSHSKLACTYFEWSFSEFLRKVAPVTQHYHIADAKGVDGEGLQIGEGEIDFEEIAAIIKQLSPTATWLPEIWQGHKNDGEGFWKAFSILEGYL